MIVEIAEAVRGDTPKNLSVRPPQGVRRKGDVFRAESDVVRARLFISPGEDTSRYEFLMIESTYYESGDPEHSFDPGPTFSSRTVDVRGTRGLLTHGAVSGLPAPTSLVWLERPDLTLEVTRAKSEFAGPEVRSMAESLQVISRAEWDRRTTPLDIPTSTPS